MMQRLIQMATLSSMAVFGYGTDHAIAQCGNPENTSCCEPNLAQTGCDDEECCEIVCNLSPLCCNFSWGSNCAILANNYCHVLCGDCGSGSASNNPCCTPNATPYCYDESCCESVGAVDPSCCDAEGGGEWDQSCADLAWQLCPELDGCQPPPDPDCGDADAGDCCSANGTPFCEDADCCATVCDIDPYCCDPDGEWDECCAELAWERCPHPKWPDQSICDPPPPSLCPPGATGDCCSDNGSPGCSSASCCAVVCADDPFCCEVTWDSICGDSAWDLCEPCEDCTSIICDPYFESCEGVCGEFPFDGCWCDPICFQFNNCCADICEQCPLTTGCNPADLTGNNIVGVTDLLIVLEQWGECANTSDHCPDPADCPADFDGDFAVDVPDLLYLLANWGGQGLPDPYSCEGSCAGGSGGLCYCDEACCDFGDCCDDKFEHCGGCMP